VGVDGDDRGRYGAVERGAWGATPGTLWVWAPGRPRIKFFWLWCWRPCRQHHNQKRHQEGLRPSLPTLVRVYRGAALPPPNPHRAVKLDFMAQGYWRS